MYKNNKGNKQWYEKWYYIIGIIAGIAAIIGLFVTNPNNDTTTNSNQIEIGDQSQAIIGNNNNVTIINSEPNEENNNDNNSDNMSDSKSTNDLHFEEILQFNYGEALSNILIESYEILNNVNIPSESDTFSVIASHQKNPIQISADGIDVLITATTSFPAERAIISSISNENVEKTFNMDGYANNWWFNANFYIKGTYTITITAYSSDGQTASDTFTYTY